MLCREYWVRDGLVTGGQYGTKEGCLPYSLPHCDHHEPGPYGNCSGDSHTPMCTDKCIAGYSKTYKQDKHYGQRAYSVRGVENIMTEIMTNGPVEGAFTVYADFPTYRSGQLKVTQHVRSVMLLCCQVCTRRPVLKLLEDTLSESWAGE